MFGGTEYLLGETDVSKKTRRYAPPVIIEHAHIADLYPYAWKRWFVRVTCQRVVCLSF